MYENTPSTHVLLYLHGDDAQGLRVGLAVGAHVCPAVVGARVGDTVGTVGVAVGPADGIAVGVEVGCVGALVGANVAHALHALRQFDTNDGFIVSLQFSICFVAELDFNTVAQNPAKCVLSHKSLQRAAFSDLHVGPW